MDKENMGEKKHKKGVFFYRKLLSLLDGSMRVLLDYPYGSEIVTQDRYSFPEREFKKDVDSLLEDWIHEGFISQEQKGSEVIIRQARYDVKHNPNYKYMQLEAHAHFMKIVFIEHGFEFRKEDWSKPVTVDELLDRVTLIMKDCLDELRTLYGDKIPWKKAKDLIPKGPDIEHKYKHYEYNRLMLENEILEKEGRANPKLQKWDRDAIPQIVDPPHSTSKRKEESSKYWFQWNGTKEQGIALIRNLKTEGFIDQSVPDDLFISCCVNSSRYNFIERKEGCIIWREKKNTLAELFLILISKDLIPNEPFIAKIESLFVDKGNNRFEKISLSKTLSRTKKTRTRKYNVLFEIVDSILRHS